jgi:carboxyl-terminal processing protease
LTTARYYTPNGRSIQATGITPDIIVEQTLATREVSERQDMIREQDLPGHLEAPSTPGDGGGTEGGVSRETEKADPQLDRAIDLLKSWDVFKTVVAQR